MSEIKTTVANFKAIHQIALPAIVGGIAEPLLSSTDAAIIGNMDYDATEALAAVGIVGSFLSTLIWIIGQTRSVISSVISQYVGSNQTSRIRDLPIQAIGFNILISIIVLLVSYFFKTSIFELLGAQDQVLKYSLAYYDIRIWGFPFTLVVFAGFGIFRGFQNTFWPMIVAAVGALVNIVLDFILVYGIEGYIPSMHVEGAAYASLISQVVMALMVLVLLFQKMDISFAIGRKVHHDIKRMGVMSFHLFLRSVSLNVALLAGVRTAATISDAEVAAHTIAMNIWLFTAFFIDGYGSAGNIYGGRLLGAKDMPQLHLLIRKITVYGIVLGTLLMLIGFVGYDYFGTIFTSEVDVLNAFTKIFFVILLIQPLSTTAFILDGLFKGFGEMLFLRNLLFIATFGAFLPTLFITQYYDLGLLGIWTAMAVWLATRSIGLLWKLKKSYGFRVV